MGAGDSELVRRAQQGDDAAFHELVDRYAQDLFRLAWSLVGNAADAEDVVQETFLGALRGLKAFQRRSSAKTWLTRILVRQAARSHRNRRRRKVISMDERRGTSRDAAGRAGEVGTGSRLDARMDVLEALADLSAKHRQVIVLREFEGMWYAEMAEALSVPRGTVESRLFRARQELRERLRAYLL